MARNNAGGTEPGRRTKLFTNAQKEFNGEVSRKLKKGNKTFIDKLDCIAIFREWHGRCAWCGLPLNVRGGKVNAVHFMMLIPLDAGGRIERDNIVTSCYADKYERHRTIPRYGFDRIYNFNTLPDLIEQLVIKTSERERARTLRDREPDTARRGELDLEQFSADRAVALLKRQADNAIVEFVYTLHYKPITSQPIPHPVPIEEESTIGYAVGKMAEQMQAEEPELEEAKELIADNLQHINQTKKYQILRRK